MSSIRVLSVGQCGFDTGQISRGLATRYGLEVVSADTHSEAVERVSAGDIRIVLVNRVGDVDGAPGLALIRALKSNPKTADLPVMLVSNYADAQTEAIAAGALPGFGKADLGGPVEKAAITRALTVDH